LGENGKGFIPPWMEEVAKAGGWEEHAKQKAQKELMEKMDKIPPEKFTQLKDMLGSMERMLDVGGSDLGILSGVTDKIEDTIKTQFDSITSELTNMINTTINTLLEPFMPAIETALNGFNTILSRGTGAIEALITGKFDEYIKNLKLELQDQVDTWQQQQTERFWGSERGRDLIEMLYGVDLDALEAAAAAGGVYSGQFDIDPDALAAILEKLDLPQGGGD
jgi:hypothetical protein